MRGEEEKVPSGLGFLGIGGGAFPELVVRLGVGGASFIGRETKGFVGVAVGLLLAGWDSCLALSFTELGGFEGVAGTGGSSTSLFLEGLGARVGGLEGVASVAGLLSDSPPSLFLDLWNFGRSLLVAGIGGTG